MRISGAIANGISHGLVVQNTATTTPSAANTSSVEKCWKEKRSRIDWPRPRCSMGAIRAELRPTKQTEAARPASAKRTLSFVITVSAPRITCALAHAPSVASV